MGDVIDFEEYRRRRSERSADPEVDDHAPTRRRSQGEANKSLPKPKRHPEQDPGDLPGD